MTPRLATSWISHRVTRVASALLALGLVVLGLVVSVGGSSPGEVAAQPQSSGLSDLQGKVAYSQRFPVGEQAVIPIVITNTGGATKREIEVKTVLTTDFQNITASGAEGEDWVCRPPIDWAMGTSLLTCYLQGLEADGTRTLNISATVREVPESPMTYIEVSGTVSQGWNIPETNKDNNTFSRRHRRGA